jgi:hypothetical protein
MNEPTTTHSDANMADGIHGMLPREKMSPEVRKLRDTYAITPGAPFYHKEFASFALPEWIKEGTVAEDADINALFGYDPPAMHNFYSEAGWVAPPFIPCFEEKVIEDSGEYELVRDYSGNHMRYIKAERGNHMPTFERTPVIDWKSWEEECKWRLDPDDERRYGGMDEKMALARADARKGFIITQLVIGGYMYLRSLMGPEGVMFKMLEEPDLVHDCMKTWLHVIDGIVARQQQHLPFDVLFFGEDSCYNHGLLVSPDLMREFVIPYHQQLITNVKARQLDKKRHLFIQVDTDGNVDQAIPLYRETGLDSMVPFEVAAGCDVVKIGQLYPDLVISGGIDKRVMAEGPDAIDKHLAAILPPMLKRGGYIPTCDHLVPTNVSFENYMHYRKRCLEYGG